MVRPSLLCCLVFGCSPSGTDLGPAVMGVYLANETDVLGLFQLRSGMGIAVGLETSTRPDGDDLFDEGLVQFDTSGTWVDAPKVGDGLFRTGFDDAILLPEVGRPVRLQMERDGQLLTLEAEVPPTLRLPLKSLSARRGQDLVIDLPTRWYEQYDHVITHLLYEDGSVAYDTRPTSAGGWLDELASPPKPRNLTIPKEVFEPQDDLILAVSFLSQLDSEAVFSDNLNQPVSGFWAGSAWLIPVAVGR